MGRSEIDVTNIPQWHLYSNQRLICEIDQIVGLLPGVIAVGFPSHLQNEGTWDDEYISRVEVFARFANWDSSTCSIVSKNFTIPDSKGTRINVDLTSIRRESVGSMSNRRRSEGLSWDVFIPFIDIEMVQTVKIYSRDNRNMANLLMDWRRQEAGMWERYNNYLSIAGYITVTSWWAR